MKVSDLIEHLSQYPSDASVELSKMLSLEGGTEPFEIRLDVPIIGTAFDEQSNDVLLVVDHTESMAAFAASVKKL